MITRMTTWHFVYIFKARCIYFLLCCNWNSIKLLWKPKRFNIAIVRLTHHIWHNLKVALAAVMTLDDVVGFTFEKCFVTKTGPILNGAVHKVISIFQTRAGFWRRIFSHHSHSGPISLSRFCGCSNCFDINYGWWRSFFAFCLKFSTFCSLFLRFCLDIFWFWSNKPRL